MKGKRKKVSKKASSKVSNKVPVSIYIGIFVIVAGALALLLSWKTLVAEFSTNTVEAAEISPIGQAGQWDLIFRDEFDTNSLDLTKWEPSWFGGSSVSKPVNTAEASCYDPAQVSVSNGKLQLTAKTTTNSSCLLRDNSRANYVSGLVNTRKSFTFTYGYVEARMYVPGENGEIWNWPAFWTDGTGTWPTTGEIDVMEGLSTHEPCWHYHYSLNGVHEQVGDCVTMTDATGWHTYGAKWEPDKITYYYDGQEVGEVTENVVNAPHFVILNYGLKESYGVHVPSTLQVDFVRVWKQNDTVPTVQVSPTATPTKTPTPTNTPTSTPRPTSTPTPIPNTPVPTNIPTNTPTNTPKPTATSTPIPTPTPVVISENGVIVKKLDISPITDINSSTNVQASITVSSGNVMQVQALTVAVRDTKNNNYDFRGAKTNVTIGPNGYSFTTRKRTFPAGEYIAFVAYKYNDQWYNLPPEAYFVSIQSTSSKPWWGRWRK